MSTPIKDVLQTLSRHADLVAQALAGVVAVGDDASHAEILALRQVGALRPVGDDGYPAEFKAEAVKQVTQRGHGVVGVAKRLGMSDKSLYLWVRLAKEQSGVGTGENTTLKAEVARLKAELKRVNEERDILKKAATYFAKLSG